MQTDPEPVEYVPAVQLWHAIEAGEAEYMPEGHTKQTVIDVAPTLLENVPATQPMH